MASITTFSRTPTQEWLLIQPIERTLTTHGIKMQVWDSDRYISKYEPLLKISSLKKKDPYWIYKSVITCYENEPKRYVVSIRIKINSPKDDHQQVQALWDKIMHEKIYEYLALPANFTAPGESFEERITSWRKDDEQDYGVKPELIKAKRVRIEKESQSSISPPKFIQKIPGKQIVCLSHPIPVKTPPLNPKKERKESKTRQQTIRNLLHSFVVSQ